jgi:para-aminobenzoate synthetase component 1
LIFPKQTSIRQYHQFSLGNIPDFKQRLLYWTSGFDTCCFLDSNDFRRNPPGYDCLAAAGVSGQFEASAGTAFNHLKDFHDAQKDWIFGHLSYDLKNELETLHSAHYDGIGFADMHWFCPEVLIRIDGTCAEIGIRGERQEASRIFSQICVANGTANRRPAASIHIMDRMPDADYLDRLRSLQGYIRAGDCYEVNFCRESYCEDLLLSPVKLFCRLNKLSPAPFAAYYRVNEKHLACSSPERYLKKSGTRILSEPIKGTAPRPDNFQTRHKGQWELASNLKERAENIMTVDLVRNDLSRIAKTDSVRVDSLCHVHAFAQVLQMISAISCELEDHLHFADAIAATFPMGSMTGAPKVRVMQLIEQYESTRRGLYSGALGYIDPAGNFDLNVVIRSILYNASERYLSFQTGSAVTCRSVAQAELEECRLKAAALVLAINSADV